MRRGKRRVLMLAALLAASSAGSVMAQQAGKPANPGNRPAAAGQPAPKAAPPARMQDPPADPRLEKLMATWERQSAKLKTLDIVIARVDKSKQWGDEKFKGRAVLESPDHVFLDFKKLDVDDKGKEAYVDFERIICTGTEVWQYKSDLKQVFIFPLDKKNQQRALEEGPLPFLFNMKADAAKARYVMGLHNENKTHFVISVVPRLTVDQEAFSKAFIWLSRETFLPDRIGLISPDESSTKDYTLTTIKPNAVINPSNFKGVDPGPPWQIVRNPGGDAPAPKAAAKGAPKLQTPTGPLRRAAGDDRRAPNN